MLTLLIDNLTCRLVNDEPSECERGWRKAGAVSRTVNGVIGTADQRPKVRNKFAQRIDPAVCNRIISLKAFSKRVGGDPAFLCQTFNCARASPSKCQWHECTQAISDKHWPPR